MSLGVTPFSSSARWPPPLTLVLPGVSHSASWVGPHTGSSLPIPVNYILPRPPLTLILSSMSWDVSMTVTFSMPARPPDT